MANGSPKILDKKKTIRQSKGRILVSPRRRTLSGKERSPGGRKIRFRELFIEKQYLLIHLHQFNPFQGGTMFVRIRSSYLAGMIFVCGIANAQINLLSDEITFRDASKMTQITTHYGDFQGYG